MNKRNRCSERTPWNPRFILIEREVKRFTDKPTYPMLLLSKQLITSLDVTVEAINKMVQGN